MSLSVIKEIDFGNVETASYFYVNMCSGPDFYRFRMKPEEAKPFMEKLDKAESILTEALKKIDDGNEEVHALCYEEGEDENEGSIVFTAYLLDSVAINREIYSEGDGIQVLDNITEQDLQHVHVVCDLVAEDFDGGSLLVLRLVSLDVVDE